MGRGIFLTKDAEQLSRHTVCKNGESAIVQEYLARPLLLDGFKFDLRIYVLVTSFSPLRVFMYKDGLVRLSTSQYQAPNKSNINDLFMHLTNYSINKDNQDFQKSSEDGEGSKRSLEWFFSWLRENGKNPDAVWNDMADVVIKTLIAGQPHNQHSCNLMKTSNAVSGGHPASNSSCFAIYGFDIMLEDDLSPYVIEVNRSPSFATSSTLDRTVKFGVIRSAIKLLNMSADKKKQHIAQARLSAQSRLHGRHPGGRDRPRRDSHSDTSDNVAPGVEAAQCSHEENNRGEFERIYPVRNDEDVQEKYTALLVSANEIFDTNSTRASSVKRQLQARSVVIEINTKDYVGPARPPTAPDGTVVTSDFLSSTTRLVTSAHSFGRSHPDQSRLLPTRCQLPAVRLQSSASPARRTTPGFAGAAFSIRQSALSKRQSVSSMGQRNGPDSLPMDSAGTAEHLILLTESLERVKLVCADQPERQPMLQDALAAHKLEEAAHRPALAAFYLRVLAPSARRRLIDAVVNSIVTLAQASVSCSDATLKKTPIFALLLRLAKQLHWNNAQGLWNCCEMGATAEYHDICHILRLNDRLPELEQKLAVQCVQTCQDALLMLFICTKKPS